MLHRCVRLASRTSRMHDAPKWRLGVLLATWLPRPIVKYRSYIVEVGKRDMLLGARAEDWQCAQVERRYTLRPFRPVTLRIRHFAVLRTLRYQREASCLPDIITCLSGSTWIYPIPQLA